MVAPVILAVVAAIAGHPVQVACDADTNPSPFPAPAGSVVTAWTLTGGNVIHATPTICGETAETPGNFQFADGLATMIHEAARARGLRSDSCVELYADMAVYQVLRDFYGLPFFSVMSERIGGQVLMLTRQLPSIYDPAICWRAGSFS